MSARVVYQAAALVLGYPSERQRALAPQLRAVVAEQGLRGFDGVLDLWEADDPAAAEQHYIDVFDLSRRRTLYLSFYADGDTRRRGETLAAFKQRYRRSGFLVDTHGELPDYLPLVLEYAARVDPRDGAELLRENRPGLELLRLALRDHSTPYAGVLEAVCGTLPGPSPRDKKAVMAMAAHGPPTERVGLEPGDPRLLPLGGQ